MSGVLQMKTKSKREPVTLGMDVAMGDDYRHHTHTTHSQMLGKFEYTGGPIFKVVLEC